MRLRGLFKRFCRNERGTVLIMAGAGAFALVGGAGLATDATQWFLWKRQIQMAADAGALAAAYTIAQGSTSIATPAQAEIDRNKNGVYTVEYIGTPPRTGAFAGNPTAAEVVLTTQQRLPFSGMFLSTAPLIRARAVAAKVIKMDSCVKSLATTGVGVGITGSADVRLNCGVTSNSNSAQSIYLQGGGFLAATTLATVGQIDTTSGGLAPGTEKFPNYLPQTDPFGPQGRNLQVPSTPAECTARNYTNKPSDSVTLSPGRYCGGMNLKGNTTLQPGVYIVDGGDFALQSQSITTGQGVTIILTGNGANTPTIQVNGGATANLTAPTASQSPEWNGILFFQDPRGNVSSSVINGGGSVNMYGAVYLPKGDITYSGSSAVVAQCIVLIANRVNLQGNSAMTNNCPQDLRDQVAFRVVRVVE